MSLQYPATGWQVGILTEGLHAKARIREVQGEICVNSAGWQCGGGRRFSGS